eukprot:4927150-Prorocentrum_lima.AAC.1
MHNDERKAQEIRQELKDHLVQYREKRGIFDAVTYPNKKATLALIIHWWKHQQPSALLAKIA